MTFSGYLPPRPTPREGEVVAPASVWQNVDDPNVSLVLLTFADLAAAADHLREVIEGNRILADAPIPTDAQHVVIENERGRVLERVPIGGFLALGRSSDGLGYGDELRRNLHETLSTFAQVEGHLGHLLGVNEAMHDEIWTFAFGETPAAVPQPESAEVATNLYTRVS